MEILPPPHHFKPPTKNFPQLPALSAPTQRGALLQMSLLNFLSEIPTELRLEILHLAGGKAAASLSLTCQRAKDLIQGDDELWMTLCEEELCDVRKRMGYTDYVETARSMKWSCSAYAWFRYIVTNCCTVCLWFCRNGLVSHGKIRLCTDCERDIRAYEKMYDV